MARVRPVGYEDRLTVVDHLAELRGRLMIAIAALVFASALAGWQNDFVLEVVNAPLEDLDQELLGAGAKPISFGVTEQFTTTLMVSAYAGLLLSLPVILYQLYAFVLPAFSPTERRVAFPLLLMVPVLFICGVLFCYYVVLEPATEFLLGFNEEDYTTAVRARDYYSFVALTTIAMGLLFQVPVVVLALTRLGITTPEKLRANRRFAILGCAVLAAMLPTIDPVTMILEMIPLLILYELSIVLASVVGRPPPEVQAEIE
ncbi:MAG TPA: twin-arginine translocase subunit TatC [Thermoleophilaceae bacterium]|nr:twin-arginine translocase subunit TatC [Thermoleophilaceae bacterium]